MSRRYSFSDDGNSFEDLETSLDKALNHASNNLFSYTNTSNGHGNGSRTNSQGSAGAIPLATMASYPGDGSGHGMARSASAEHNDSSPLIASNLYANHNRSFSSSASSLNATARSLSMSSKRFLRKALGFFRHAHRELSSNGDRLRLSSGDAALGSTSVGRNGSGPSSESSQRFISPRSKSTTTTYPSNAISNAKYNPITFIPIILYEQFKFFFNLYFLVVALSQIIPQLRIGYLSSYIVPLGFVLTVTMMKEAGDDIARRRRDREQNNELYEVLNRSSPSALSNEIKLIPSRNLKVGDLVRLHKDTRIPADMVLLQTSDKDGSGEAFIKTDQLDGETDWKLRIANSASQSLTDINSLINNISLIVGNPTKSIHHFNGKLIYHPSSAAGSTSPTSSNETIALTVDQTLWANTVLASGTAIAIVVYTGVETRQAMNTTMTGVKTGLLELEINSLSKILCFTVFLLSVVLVLANGFPLKSTWYIDIMRFLILFSTIIPVSLRVNLDLAKSVYASQIQKDDEIPNTIVRTSTIPEDLGRIEYLLSDKTGTLTQNDMELKKLHLGAVSYAGDTMDIVTDYITSMLSILDSKPSGSMKKRDLGSKVCDLVLTLALCHNVTPSYEDEEDEAAGIVTYQAASPDEIAIVKFTELVGLKLYKRDRHTISLMHLATGKTFDYEILYNFPFNSDTKRMGIIVKDSQRDEIWFMQKGADTVMTTIVNSNDWLDEETGNMAREGLRTLVIGRKRLSSILFKDFVESFQNASLAMHDREATMQKIVSQYLEQDLELLGLTGVEDKLQRDVKTSIELLRNAGVKIWMLTGDKVETAKCVSISARLISRGQYVHQITKINHPDLAMNQLEYLKTNTNACLLIDGESLATYMKFFKHDFFEIVVKLPAVIACRCSPQQKADVALMIREITGKRVCCIGDGGNDVSMIQCADVGVGIVGKEGKQASLAADFSIDQFCYLSKLLLWHGRNSYKRSAKLGQFIIHRGLLISVAQAVYSISSKFEPLALYQGWLMVGYSTVYTMAPVFSLTLDCDIDEHLTRLYPELYKELTLGKSLSYRTFFMWVAISLFQGSVIQLLSQQFQTVKLENFKTMVALSFSSLIYNELIMVGLSINKWNKVMVSTIIITFLIYIGSVPFLGEYFDLEYVSSVSYIWQVAVLLAISLFPVWLSQYINRKLRPPSYAKVQTD
ncbi:hypothetical protein G9P44_001847 [Scheffersomyces stipitis]|nr:hypothetical protein G9P44_001847 [Scheffersomyces stipitis]